MRRENIDLSYKERSQEIIDNIYDPWQLPRKNRRDVVHSIANRVVSLTQELGSEINYVQNMFFPDMMDINEEWLVYEIKGEVNSSEIYLPGIHL